MMNNVYYIKNNASGMHLTLADLQERIQNGDVESLAIAAVLKNGDVLSGHVCSTGVFTLLGALTSLAHRVEDGIE